MKECSSEIYLYEKICDFLMFTAVNKAGFIYIQISLSLCLSQSLFLSLSLSLYIYIYIPYIKPTDGHQYLHYQSSHRLHIMNSIPYSQALRVSRICSSEQDFKMHVFHMKEWFLARRYPKIVVNKQIDKVVFS